MLLDGLVGWLQGDKNRGGVMSSSAGSLGGAMIALHWRKKVLPLELMSRRVALIAHRGRGCVLHLNLDELI